MAKHAIAREPEVLDALEEELALVKADSSIVEQFAGKLRVFFNRARVLEATALANLVSAQLVKAPTTMQEDEAIQFQIKNVGADRKEAVDHWDITIKLWHFHKRVCTARGRSENPNDRAIALLTGLHNGWVEQERRRVAAENERLRREAEQQAAADRARDLAELERQALVAEEASKDLSARELVFVARHLAGFNILEAARMAGYKEPSKAAPRLIEQPKIVAAIEASSAAAALREQKTAIAQKPLDVQAKTVTADISTAGGFDRSSHSAELLDERLLIEAILAGGRGIPSDLLQVNPAKLNEYARSMHELINRWPGVRYKKTTSLV